MPEPARKSLLYGRKNQKGLNVTTAVAMSGFHLGALLAFFYADFGAILVAVVLYCLAGMLGIGMGYHRLLTHRGYKTYKPVEYFLTWCGTLALEGGPVFWVATHRVHHQHSDREGDPHTPREGTWWAHAGWILRGEGLHHDASVLSRYVPDLVRDPVQMWLSRWHWTSNVLVGLVLLLVGGLQYVLWGIFLRVTLGLHATWLVNSATHKWGSRRFATRDDSTNNWWVALLTFGEGWHNNHHAHPTSARHGLAWYEIDLNWIGIRALEACGLAWDVKRARLQFRDARVYARVNRSVLMKKLLVVALAIVAGGLIPVAAQDKPLPAAAQPAASSSARQISLKVQLTLTRFMGEKKISSVPYMLGVLTNSQKTSLRMGVQVPVVATVFGAKSEGVAASMPQSGYTYRDIGTNIDCQAEDAGNGLFNLVITVDDSTIHLDRATEPAEDKKTLRGVPAFRSFRASFAILLRDGQTMQYASATDPISGEVMRIDVALSLAK